MNPGLLDRKITIERPVSTPDGMGGRSTAWETLCTTWALFKPPKMRQEVVQGGIASVVTHEITIRFCSGITPGCRVVEGDRTYGVIGVGVIDRRYMTLTCKEVERFGS